MSDKRKPKVMVPKTSKAKLAPKKSIEEELYASMAQCLDVIPAEKPDPANLNILKGKRPNIREIAWFWLPANQENLSEPGHCRTFTIPEANDQEITASDLSIPQMILQDSSSEEIEITEPSTSAELQLTETDSDISSSLLSTDFENLSVSNKTSIDEVSYKTASDENISNKGSTTSQTSMEADKEDLAKIKKTRFKDQPSIERSIASTTEEEIRSSMASSGKFINKKPEDTGNYKLDAFTHGFYQLLEAEEEQQASKTYCMKDTNFDPQSVSETDITSYGTSFGSSNDTTESFHLIDPIPIHALPTQVSERSPEAPSNRSATPTSDRTKPENNFNVDLISARSSDDGSKLTALTPRDDELYVCGSYSIYPITELTEPSSCNSDFEEPLVGFDEFHQVNPKKPPKNTAWEIDTTSINKPHLECGTESEFETTDDTDSDNDNYKLHKFNMQELGKFPPNKIGIRFKRILKVNGKHIFDCKCNYHLLPARYQKKYRNPENLLLEFNHLLLPSDETVYFSSHYCPYTIQEMNDIMEITGGLKYLPQSYIMQYVLHNKYQKPAKKYRLRTSSPFIEKKEMVISLVQRPSIAEVPVQEEFSPADDPLNSPIVLPPLEERQASRSKRPITRRWDSKVKRPE